MGSFGRMIMSSPRAYFDEVLTDTDRLDSLPVRRDDLQHHAPGCYSAHSGIKEWQKRAQFALLSAESWAAIVAIRDDVSYPREQLERAWKQVLFNQFHDVLPGSAIDSAYTDARDQLGEAVAIAKRILVRSHNILARQVTVPFEDGTQPVLVFNSHPWPVTTDVDLNYGSQKMGVHVVDDEGEPVLFQHTQSTATTGDNSRGAIVFRAEVPALGYRLYRLRAGEYPAGVAANSLTTSDTVLENELVRVELDATSGWISSYLDKRTGVDVMAGVDGSTHTQICQDPTDTWGHRVVSYAWPGAPMATKRIVVRESGPLRLRIRIERAWDSSTLVEEWLLDHDSAVLRIDVSLDWREKAHLLKLRFPTRLDAPAATYDVPFGSLERPVDGAEQPAQSWVDLTGTIDGHRAGLTVITTNKHGFDASGGAEPSIGVTAVRSPVYSWHDPRLLEKNGIYSYQDQGLQHFSVELVPHAGDWRTADPDRRAIVLGSPVRAMLESSHGGSLPARHSFASDEGAQVRVTAVKGSEDAVGSAGSGTADLLVRAVESRGEPALARIDLPVVDRVLEEAFTPHQIRTFRVPRDPALPVVEVDLIEEPLAVGQAAPTATPEFGVTEPVPPLPQPGSEERRSSAPGIPLIE
jgi:alpha-mannosidase